MDLPGHRLKRQVQIGRLLWKYGRSDIVQVLGLDKAALLVRGDEEPHVVGWRFITERRAVKTTCPLALFPRSTVPMLTGLLASGWSTGAPKP